MAESGVQKGQDESLYLTIELRLGCGTKMFPDKKKDPARNAGLV